MAWKGWSRENRWVVAPLVLLLAGVLLWAVFVVRRPSRSGVTFASQDGKAGQSEKDKEEDPNEAKVRRPDHNHPAFTERRREREQMVVTYIEQARFSKAIEDPKVIAAMKTVPRHAFVGPGYLRRAYADHPLPIGMNQTISQPYIVAYMTEVLKLDPNSRVFEVGTGSGY
ncbi:MAG: protein-L-isoaspartate O-methyltransferase family protein, partial [Planctomycetota bacterium]